MFNKDELLSIKKVEKEANELIVVEDTINEEKKQKRFSDFYNKLKNNIEKWYENNSYPKYIKEIVLLAPNLFYLVWKLSVDKRIPINQRRKIAYALIYFVLPIDIIIDVAPGIGHLDDVFVACWVLNGLMNEVDQEIVNEYWKGNENVLTVIQSVLTQINSVTDVIRQINPKNMLNSEK